MKTDQLDGETDWKIREPVKYTQEIMDRDELSIFDTDCCINCMEPSMSIYEFNGIFYPYSHSREEDFESLRVKNTLWANTVVASGEAWG